VYCKKIAIPLSEKYIKFGLEC